MNIYNYNHLYYFYITAKLKGVTIAAKHLNTSQSSLSTQIKTLEHTLKRPLFKKSGRKIELTDFGRETYNYCRRAFEVFDEMFDQIEKKSFSMGSRISIGVSAEIERPFISESITKVSQQYPKTQKPLLNLISLPSSQLIQLLKLGELDILLTTGVETDNDIQIVSEFEFDVGAFATSNYITKNALPAFEKFNIKNEIPIILPSKGTLLRAEIDNYFAQKKMRTKSLFESNIISAIARAACNGLGVTILPEPYLRQELQHNRIIRINNKALWKHRVFALVKRGPFEENRKIFLYKLALLFEKNLNIRTKINFEIGPIK